MKPTFALRHFLAIAGSTVLSISYTHAQSNSWLGDSAGNWSDGTKWTGGTTPADGADNTATFGNVITLDRIVTLDGPRTIGNITASDTSHNYTISGANILTLDRTIGVPTIDVTQSGRTLTIGSVVAGNDGLIKNGAGTLLLNTNNTFTGNVVVNAGTLALEGTNTFTDITINGATLNLGPTSSSVGAGKLGAAGGNLIFTGTSSINPMRDSAVVYNKNVSISGTTTFNWSTQYYHNSFSGVLSGAGTLVKNDSNGILTFSNSANTFTGAIRLDGGSGGLVVNSLADSANAITFNANTGAFSLGAGTASSLLFNNRQIVLAHANGGEIANNNASTSNTITINTNLGFSGAGTRLLELGGTNTGANAFNGNITNNGGSAVSLTKSGTGTWALGGTNSYTGATTITSGTLVVSTLADGSSNSNIGASGSGAGNLILNGGTLRYTGAAVDTDRLFSLQSSSTIDASGTGALNFDNTGAMGFNGGTVAKTLTLTGANTGNNTIAAVIGDLTNATSVVKNGIGTWVLSGNTNSYTGTTTLNTGRLVLDYAASDTTKLANGAALNLGGGTLELSGGNHTEVVASTTLTNNTGSRIIQTNSGTSVLQLGNITRPNGSSTLSLAADNIATTNNTNVNGILGPGYTVGSHWAVNSTNGANGAIVALSTYTTTVPTITGVNTANYQLTGSQTQTGTTTSNTLRIVSNGNDQILDLGNNRNFSLNSANGVMGSLIYAGGGNNNYTINGTGTSAIVPTTGNNHVGLNVFQGTLTVNALLGSGSGTVTKWGAGTLVVGSNNTAQSGAYLVQEGTLRLANNGATGTTAGGIVVSNGAALELSNSVAIGAEALTISGYGISNAGALRNVAGNTSSYAGAITVNTATSMGGARINSDAGGSLTLSGGVVTSLFNNVTFGGAGNTTVQTVAISGAGGLTKDGAGTTTLTNSNTYTGATNIDAGTLRVNGAGSINSTSGINVAAGASLVYNSSTALTVAPALNGSGGNKATLGGTGTINVALALNSIDDVLAPGNSPGIQPFGTSQTWSSFTYEWETNNFTGTTAGTDFDQIAITGNLSLTGAAPGSYILDLFSLTAGDLTGDVGSFAEGTRSWEILTTSGTITGFDANFWTLDDSGFTSSPAWTGTWTLTGTSDALVLNYTIPEPGAALLGSLGFLLIFRRRR